MFCMRSRNDTLNCRARSLAFDTGKQISSIHKKGITWLDLEQVESRYLLAGGADCSVAIYDVAQPISAEAQSSAGGQDYGSVLKITTATPGCHQYSISSVDWYPIDTGLFVTGSFDHQVKVRCQDMQYTTKNSSALQHCLTSHFTQVHCRYGMQIWAKLLAASCCQTACMAWLCQQSPEHTVL